MYVEVSLVGDKEVIRIVTPFSFQHSMWKVGGESGA